MVLLKININYTYNTHIDKRIENMKCIAKPKNDNVQINVSISS